MTNPAASLTRRHFLRNSGMVLAGLAAGQPSPQSVPAKPEIIAPPLLDLHSLQQFVDPLPIPLVAKANGTRPHPEHPALQIPYYRLAMRQFESKIHRDV